MFQRIRVPLNQRVVVLRDGVPQRALGPGRHSVWGLGRTFDWFDTDALVFEARRAVRAVLPAEWFSELRLGKDQRGLLLRDGRPHLFLRPGVHRYWTLDGAVELRLFDVAQPVPALTDEVLAVIPRGELCTTVVCEHERGLLYVQGRFERVLEPGRHTLWSTTDAPVSVRTVDMRQRQLAIAGQELMTRDKVTLRLTLTAEWAPLDPETAAHLVSDPEAALYSAVQLAVREYVAGVTLDQLLEGRDALAGYVRGQAVPEAERFGVRLVKVGVKDVVLPGEMKTLLNRVIEAQKEAEANVISRREEAAQARAQANAARLMEERPALLRLKELEVLRQVAGNVGSLNVVLGHEDVIKQLLPTRNS